ncbi:TraB/GumN family protein [Sphingomonas sp. IC-56]|uniref:TraB/GumN family protein n=1 Tax=Sphingomonas sp. IC-56 TaxID=2898529 RepID=UPI001E5ABA03|nr:TraB/GumN family protein [Sphingomonas sp. IC-56]MCD2324798.1 TraB/GumN family protein [Sphingomonas sp. IC-56]
MRKFLAALALTLAPAAYAQTSTDSDPALWVVKDADTTVYLFGTVHVLKPGLSWFDEAVKTAFDKSDQLVIEMVEPDQAAIQQLVMKMAVNPTGPTLTEKLPADKREAYAKAMADVGIPAAAFDRLDPWVAAITLGSAGLPKLGYDPNSGADKVLANAAKSVNKPVQGLETLEQQLGYFDGLPEPLQVKFLVSTVDDYSKTGEILGKMIQTWSAGDPEALGKTMNEEMRDTPEIAKVLLTDRNVRWADWIQKRMAQPGTVFVAVGAGHLAGADSVQAQLAKRQLNATRVPY